MRVTKTPRRRNKTLLGAGRAPHAHHIVGVHLGAHVVVEMLSYTTADKRLARHFITRLNGPLYVMLCVCVCTPLSAVGKILVGREHFRHAAVYLGCNSAYSAIPRCLGNSRKIRRARLLCLFPWRTFYYAARMNGETNGQQK